MPIFVPAGRTTDWLSTSISDRMAGTVVSVTPRVKTVRPLKVYGRGELLASYLRSRFVVVVRHRSEI